MFGYVTVNRPELKVRDLELYRSYYCGLCAQLHRRYGRRGQILLSYDCTFLILLLTGAYEPEEGQRMGRCIVHPAVVHRETSNRFTEYAADMNVLLSYLKAEDDWRDDRSQSAKLLAMLLRADYLKLKERYPGQEKAVRENVRKLQREEQRLMRRKSAAEGGKGSQASGDTVTQILLRLDRMAGYTGAFFGELCAPYQDPWAEDLRRTGFYLGKFIYLMDAYDDMEKDRAGGNCNVLLDLRAARPDDFEDQVRQILLDTAACYCRAFERLPIVKDVELLRNILYSGIWVRFHQIREEKRKGTYGRAAARMERCVLKTPGGARCGGKME